MQVSGVVTSLRDFGAFVDIGGVDGLIPISELAWGQTDRVEDVLSRGQQVEVIIKRLDWDRDRISLSLRETTENPWGQGADRLPSGLSAPRHGVADGRFWGLCHPGAGHRRSAPHLQAGAPAAGSITPAKFWRLDRN